MAEFGSKLGDNEPPNFCTIEECENDSETAIELVIFQTPTTHMVTTIMVCYECKHKYEDYKNMQGNQIDSTKRYEENTRHIEQGYEEGSIT
jgi:hypothetical protein